MNQQTKQQNNKKLILLSIIIFFVILIITGIICIWQNYDTPMRNFFQDDKNFIPEPKIERLNSKINNLNNKIAEIETDKNILLAQIDELQLLLTQQQQNNVGNIIGDTSIIKTLTSGWSLYRNEMYGYEIKYPTTVGIGSKIIFSHGDGTGISIINPMVEAGYEAWDATKIEKIKISDDDKYLTKRYFSPSADLPEKDKKEFKPFILATWGDDNWKNSGQISFSYEDDSDPNLKLYNEILSTFRLIDQKEKK